jgi:CheY-like chemotaxis protein
MAQSLVDVGDAPAQAKILVVEDEPLIRYIIAEVLREMGLTVVEASTGDEAWQYLTSGGDVDVVFTDHRMPGSMLGAELAGRIQRDYPLIGVVVTSANLERGEWPGPFLTKPYDLFVTATDLAEQAIKRRQGAAER